jgi:hypothetical protein
MQVVTGSDVVALSQRVLFAARGTVLTEALRESEQPSLIASQLNQRQHPFLPDNIGL